MMSRMKTDLNFNSMEANYGVQVYSKFNHKSSFCIHQNR